MNSDTRHYDVNSLQATEKEGFELLQQVSPSAMSLRATDMAMEYAVNPHVDRFFSKDMMLCPEMPKSELVEQAESYHGHYRENEVERMDTLKSLYIALGEPKDIIVMILCKKYFLLFNNWLSSCDKHGIPVLERLLVFALDDESAQLLSDMGVKHYLINPRYYGEAGGADSFGDYRFSRTMFYKNAIIRDMLNLNANVLFQDVDVIWLKNPFGYFLDQCHNYDIAIMYDGPNPNHRPIYANTGFIYATCTKASKAFFETALRNTASIFYFRGHQKPFNRILAYFLLHNILTAKVLPQTLFLNGHLFNIKQGLLEKAGDWKNNGYVVHYSWTHNREEKRQKIVKFGLSYLPDNPFIK